MSQIPNDAEVVSNHKSENSVLVEVTNYYEKGDYGYLEIIEGRDDTHQTITEISFRNVGERNKNSSIQFSGNTRKNGRTKHFSFSVPHVLSGFFLNKIDDKALADKLREIGTISSIISYNMFDDVYKVCQGSMATHERIYEIADEFYEAHKHITEWENLNAIYPKVTEWEEAILYYATKKISG